MFYAGGLPGLSVTTENQQFGEAEGDFVDFPDFEFRDVVILKIAIAVLRDLHDAHE